MTAEEIIRLNKTRIENLSSLEKANEFANKMSEFIDNFIEYEKLTNYCYDSLKRRHCV